MLQWKLERDTQHTLSLVVMSGEEDEECFILEGETACGRVEIKGKGNKRERVDEQGAFVRRLCASVALLFD